MNSLQALAGDWPALSALLDEALARPAAERAAWLDTLPAAQAALKDKLRPLLAAQARAETDDFLGTLPRLRAAAAAGTPGDADAQAGDGVGPYRLLSLLGQGGMGAVWLAERSDGQLRRRVALKLPRLAWGGALAERLLRERDILAQLTHPNIARLYDAGVDSAGRPYLALEYVEGRPIDVYCRECALPLRARLGLLLQVAAAVAHAHARLVVHRDLKPANVLVTDAGEVRLLDFGIAKLLEGEHTEETQLTRQSGRALTLDYASPEQIRGEPLGTASDVYSLGVLAYELLSGAKPYRLKRSSAAELEDAIASVEPVLASVAADAPATRKALRGDLDAILNRALKKRAQDRYPSVDALAQDIGRHLRAEPVLARPDTWRYRSLRFVLRHRLAVAAGGSVVSALLAGAGVALWQAGQAREQARLALQQAEIATREARRAEAVQGFLLNIFRTNTDAQADPQRARNTTARELLDIGAARLGTALKDAPEARAAVTATLSEMYGELELQTQAAALADERVALLRQSHGPDDRRVAEALVALARWLQATPRRAEIMPALLEARRILDAAGDRTSRLRGDLLTTLAQRHQNISLTLMKDYADEAVRVLRLHVVPNEDRLSTALHLAARARALLGEPADAERMYLEALTELAREQPVPQLALLQLRVPLADSQIALQKWTAAVGTLREAVRDATAALGLDAPGTLFAESKLAALLHSIGQRVEARRLHVDVLARVLKVRGADDTLFTPQLRSEYAQSLLAEGRPREALALMEQVVAVRRKHYPGSATLASGLRIQAAALTAVGRYDEARRLYARALPMWQAAGGKDMLPWRQNRFYLDEARLDLALRDPAAALSRLAKVAARPPGQGVAPFAEEIEHELLSSRAHLQQGDNNAALTSARQAYGGFAGAAAAAAVRGLPALHAEAALTLAQALLRAGQPAAAQPLVEQALAWRRANDAAGSAGITEAQAVQLEVQRAARS